MITHRRDVVARGHFVHHGEQNLFHDCPQAAGAGAAQDRLIGDRFQRVVGELQFDAVEFEQLDVLLDQGVARLGEDADQRLPVEAAARS